MPINAGTYQPQAGLNIIETGDAIGSSRSAIATVARFCPMDAVGAVISTLLAPLSIMFPYGQIGNLVVVEFGNGRTYVVISGRVPHERLWGEVLAIETLDRMHQLTSGVSGVFDAGPLDPKMVIALTYRFSASGVVLTRPPYPTPGFRNFNEEQLDERLEELIRTVLKQRAEHITDDVYVMDPHMQFFQWEGDCDPFF